MIEQVSLSSANHLAKPATSKAAQPSFAQYLLDAIKQVNQYQLEAEQMTQKLAAGEITDLHQVMIAGQKASISLQLAIQVRNKVVEAYQEIMRMPV